MFRTFLDCAKQAAFHTKAAIADGYKLIEVGESPPFRNKIFSSNFKCELHRVSSTSKAATRGFHLLCKGSCQRQYHVRMPVVSFSISFSSCI